MRSDFPWPKNARSADIANIVAGKYRAVLILDVNDPLFADKYVLDEWSFDRIAAEMKVSPSTARRRVRKSLLECRDRIRELKGKWTLFETCANGFRIFCASTWACTEQELKALKESDCAWSTGKIKGKVDYPKTNRPWRFISFPDDRYVVTWAEKVGRARA